MVFLSTSGRLFSFNISEKKDVGEKPVDGILVMTDYGIEGDASPASEWHRRISLFAVVEL